MRLFACVENYEHFATSQTFQSVFAKYQVFEVCIIRCGYTDTQPCYVTSGTKQRLPSIQTILKLQCCERLFSMNIKPNRSTYISIYFQRARWCSGNAVDLYSGNILFKSWPGILSYFVIFLSLPLRMPIILSNRHDRFLPNPYIKYVIIFPYY
jgi:hypothetical protein